MRNSLVLSALLLSLCLSACKTASPSIIARYEGDLFRGCHVHTGWKADQLIEECGQPTATFLNANGESVCYAYDSISLDTASQVTSVAAYGSYFGAASSTARGTSGPAAFHMICLEPSFKYKKAIPARIPSGDLARFRVRQTFAITSLPRTSTAASGR